MDEALKNSEIVSLADSQMLRWIDELNGSGDTDEQAASLMAQIRRCQHLKNSRKNRERMAALRRDLYEIQFKPDYLCVIMDRNSDYRRAVKGFTVNGIAYHRLLGTNGGIKASTIVFVSERLYGELSRRVENDRDASIPMVTAKLEAHKALTCSASVPVSFPNGILVVNDCETTFLSDIIYLTDEGDGEPVMEERHNQEVTVDASDGCGMMLPSLAERWSHELGLSYTASGMNTRFAFEKGMVFPFDFIDFADRVAHEYIVRDAWGDEVDIRNVELVLTTSMVKLWDSYASCEEYIRHSLDNHYSFGITKTCPEELESSRHTNYQFIQPYQLNGDEIEELIKPTMDEFKDILGGDWRKTVLFLSGATTTDDEFLAMDSNVSRAIMIDPRMLNDPFIRQTVYSLVHHQIERAKIGALKVHGNYSMISGDLYSLCQSIFGLPVTGLLKAGQIYNRYWSDYSGDSVHLACFRAPMSCANNIRLVDAVDSEELSYWFRYMKTCTVINSWDTMQAALNGADMDGDMVMLTDNRILVEKMEPSPALMCIQRKAAKQIPSEDDFVESNIASFGNEIGKITNRVTSMFELLSRFPEDSREAQALRYRIQCGQLYQQNAIDKAKGIVCKPMPKTWYDWHNVNDIPDPEEKAFYRSIVADRKPYFMRYIYPSLAKEFRAYNDSIDRVSYWEYRKSVSELENLPENELTDQERDFLSRCHAQQPVGTADYTMNRICRRFEDEFDHQIHRPDTGSFDASILKSGRGYDRQAYQEVEKLYVKYNEYVRELAVWRGRNSDASEDYADARAIIRDVFEGECADICSNREELCDILIDICYSHSATKRFVWDLFGDQIIDNMLTSHDGIIRRPVPDENGDIVYDGERYSVHTSRIGGWE